MAINTLQPIEYQKKKDPMDTILQGLQIANEVFKIPVAYEQYKSYGSQREGQELKNQLERGALAGGVTAEQALTKGYVRDDEKGDVTLKVIGEGGALSDGKFRQGADLNTLVKQLEAQKLIHELKTLPTKDEAARLDIDAKKKSLDTPSPQQSQAALFSKRMTQANDVLEGLAKGGYDRASRVEGIKALLPGFAQSGEIKQQQQAEQNFISAILRRESGAAISPKEFETASQQYFPRAGDTPEVLEQKRQNRILAIEGLRAEAGAASQKIPDIEKRPVGKPSGPKPGHIEDGYRFRGGDPGDKNNWEKL